MASKPETFRPKGRPTHIERERQYDAKRRLDRPWRALYKTAGWQAIRERVLAGEPLCRRCKAEGFVVIATVVNHEVRHLGDPELFFSGPFEPLCKPHHDREAQRDERAAERRDLDRGVRPV